MPAISISAPRSGNASPFPWAKRASATSIRAPTHPRYTPAVVLYAHAAAIASATTPTVSIRARFTFPACYHIRLLPAIVEATLWCLKPLYCARTVCSRSLLLPSPFSAPPRSSKRQRACRKAGALSHTPTACQVQGLAQRLQLGPLH